MAKNKNRKQGAPQNRPSQAEQAREHTQRQSEAHESPVSHIQGGPADVARKKQKSFGHN
ncbi:hypothetical protein [Streptomyces roseochromogenus]|uniref:Small hydrophilic protein n=1 Tax=Streptomyces roseochromogenus subsp. oscitans DS 12.976 TaxID=1352936 RepID=V6JVH5_STRRC|nr:hypothetical protein [Streptomyces roseochromogenus]EST23141.1 hypothetical protein M878_33810 [Streptomyces roseochromogenus subsp. oscitans DS 12.976]